MPVALAVALSCCAGAAYGDLGSPAPGDDGVPWWRTHLRTEAAAMVGGNGWITRGLGGTNLILSSGAGGRAGVSIDRVHLGLSAMYYFAGDGSSNSSGFDAIEGGFHFWSLLLGTDVGYDLRAGIWTFRPQLGFGAHDLHFRFFPFTGEIGERWDAYFEPGVTTLVKLGIVTLGVDLNVLFVTMTINGVVPTYTAHGQLGIALP